MDLHLSATLAVAVQLAARSWINVCVDCVAANPCTAMPLINEVYSSSLYRLPPYAMFPKAVFSALYFSSYVLPLFILSFHLSI